MLGQDLNKYIELLLEFDNYDIALNKCKELLKITHSQERKQLLKNLINNIQQEEYESLLNGVIVIKDNNDLYPIRLKLEASYDTGKTIMYCEIIEKLIKKATNIVESYFARKKIFIDINPHKIHIPYLDKLEKYNMQIESLELAVAVAIYQMVVKNKIEKYVIISGGINSIDELVPIDMLKEKLSIKSPKYKFIIPKDNKPTKTKVIKVDNFSSLIDLLFLTKKDDIDKRFLGEPERMFNIAEMYFQNDDEFSYLPLLENIEIYLRTKKQAKYRNLYFLTLIRLAMHFNQAGKQNIAYKYFQKALKIKNDLSKKQLLEPHVLSVEFNNIYAVFLKDIYEIKEGIKLLKNNINEKKKIGRHLLISTKGTLAQYFLQLGYYDKAEKLLKGNIKLLKEHDKSGLSRTYCYLAKLYTLNNKYRKAKLSIRQAYKYIRYANNSTVQKTFILYEEIRYYCKKNRIKIAERKLELLKNISRKIKYSYMFDFAQLLIGEHLIGIDKGKALNYLLKSDKNIFSKTDDYKIQIIKSYAKFYLQYKEKSILTMLNNKIAQLSFLGNKFKFLYNVNENTDKKLRMLIKTVNII